MCVLLITRLLRGVGRWAGKPVNHTSWVVVVTPADRPKSLHNRCVIGTFFVAVFVLSLCPFDISVGVGAIVIGLSQISSFLFFYFCLITLHDYIPCQYQQDDQYFSTEDGREGDHPIHLLYLRTTAGCRWFRFIFGG